MTRKPRGLFITGSDTEIGKTYIGSLIARDLATAGHRVGVYKPAASGCSRGADGQLVADDAVALWEAAGRPRSLDEVCPQKFLAPLAPHLAAAADNKQLDAARLRSSLDIWLESSDIVLVEGAGGLLSPMGELEYVADLAYDFGFPLVVVVKNALGAINQALQTLVTAATFRDGLTVAGIVLNQPRAGEATDAERRQNAAEIAARVRPPVLADVPLGAKTFEPKIDWFELAKEARPPRKLSGRLGVL